MKKRYVWMMVTDDEYELPIVIADSAEELARRCRVSKSAVYNSTNDGRKHKRYVKVLVDF